MKTLDEVIEAMERCGKPHYFDCNGCPYEDDDAEVGCRSDDRDEDALHYLKEYKELTAELVELNEPLSWETLKQMFRKPVWIETTAKKGWNIIVSIDSADMQVIHTSHRGPKLSGFSKASLGKTWQAYRKERNAPLSERLIDVLREVRGEK